jgi:aspartyl-tRNA(Asn)/glutamyl-tRNA(Gln) amidotransferase subunit C
MSGIDRSTVEKVAGLARIALSDAEIERFTAQLSNILTHVDRLKAVDTEDIAPTASILPLVNVTRADEIRPSLPLDDVFRNAGDRREGDFFVVQTPLEERG